MFCQNFWKLTKMNHISSIKYNENFLLHSILFTSALSFLSLFWLTVLFLKRTGHASYLTRERRQATVRIMDRVMNITSTSPVSSDRHMLTTGNIDQESLCLLSLNLISERLMQQGVKVELQLMLFQLVWILLVVC